MAKKVLTKEEVEYVQYGMTMITALKYINTYSGMANTIIDNNEGFKESTNDRISIIIESDKVLITTDPYQLSPSEIAWVAKRIRDRLAEMSDEIGHGVDKIILNQEY
jgi:hypothetical protein